MEGCQLFISGSNVVRKDPEARHIAESMGDGEYRHLAVRRGHEGFELAVEGSVEGEPESADKSHRSPSSKDDESANSILKEAPGATFKERGVGPDWNSFASSVLDGTPAETHQTTAYVSSCTQGCDDIEQELCASTLECKLCGAANGVRTSCCRDCMFLFGR